MDRKRGTAKGTTKKSKKGGKKKLKKPIPFPVRWALILLVIFLGGFGISLVLDSLSGVDIFKNFDLGLVKREKRSVSDIVLTETREVFSLATVEYIHKSVFPFDFIEGDGPWEEVLGPIIEKRRAGEQLGPGEERNLALYLFSLDLGLRPDPPDYDFVVVTSIIRAGYDVEKLFPVQEEKAEEKTEEKPEEKDTTNQSDATGDSSIFSYNEEKDILSLSLPKPEILFFSIEDVTSETYGYPDIAITPEHWRELTDFIREDVKYHLEMEDILDRAEKNTKQFLETVLTGAGFKDIRFR